LGGWQSLAFLRKIFCWRFFGIPLGCFIFWRQIFWPGLQACGLRAFFSTGLAKASAECVLVMLLYTAVFVCPFLVLWLLIGFGACWREGTFQALSVAYTAHILNV
jgi:hypothetical protein